MHIYVLANESDKRILTYEILVTLNFIALLLRTQDHQRQRVGYSLETDEDPLQKQHFPAQKDYPKIPRRFSLSNPSEYQKSFYQNEDIQLLTTNSSRPKQQTWIDESPASSCNDQGNGQNFYYVNFIQFHFFQYYRISFSSSIQMEVKPNKSGIPMIPKAAAFSRGGQGANSPPHPCSPRPPKVKNCFL